MSCRNVKDRLKLKLNRKGVNESKNDTSAKATKTVNVKETKKKIKDMTGLDVSSEFVEKISNMNPEDVEKLINSL